MGWKPREEYKTLVSRHEVILTRCKMDGQYLAAPPMCVIWRDGHFYTVPGVPITLGGASQCGWWLNDHFDEWMEIPE